MPLSFTESEVSHDYQCLGVGGFFHTAFLHKDWTEAPALDSIKQGSYLTLSPER